MLLMFYQSVMASVLFYAAVCWGGNMSKRDTGRLDMLVRKAGSVVGQNLDSLGTVVERRMWSKLLAIMGNVNHSLHHILAGQSSSLHSGRLNTLRSQTERHRRSFVPAAINYNYYMTTLLCTIHSTSYTT